VQRRPPLNALLTAAALLAAASSAVIGASAAAPAPSSGAASASSAADPWVWLARVRRSLVEAGPTGATFTQTYIPAGFTGGEKETGSLSLHLPDCLRWDYNDPYPKGFLLCGDLVHAWNPEDHTGRRYHVDRKAEPGLDLLLLGVDDLKARYGATARSTPNGQVEIALSPKARTGQLSDASLAIDPASLRLVGVSYHDREGNLTHFQIAGYHSLSAGGPHAAGGQGAHGGEGGDFAPPAGIRWEEQQ
jgi:hypothetical protein